MSIPRITLTQNGIENYKYPLAHTLSLTLNLLNGKNLTFFPERHMIIGGLYYAMAHMKDPEGFRDWQYCWTPGMVSCWENMFGEHDPNTDFSKKMFSPTHAIFIRPHIVSGQLQDSIAHCVEPWLIRKIPDIQDRLVQDIGYIVDELAENISEHSNPDKETKSFVGIQYTDTDIYISCLDDGRGFFKSFREKLPKNTDDNVSLLKHLFKGTYQGWGRQRGQGLPRIFKSIQKWSGVFYCETDGHTIFGDKVRLETYKNPTYDGEITYSTGTIYSIRMPIPIPKLGFWEKILGKKIIKYFS